MDLQMYHVISLAMRAAGVFIAAVFVAIYLYDLGDRGGRGGEGGRGAR